MKFNRKGLTDEQLIELYKAILKPRMIEEKMLILLRQGKFPNGFWDWSRSYFCRSYICHGARRVYSSNAPKSWCFLQKAFR